MQSKSPDNAPDNPVVPVQLSLDDKIRFRCHKGIACFNKCCENIDILLTPYDVLRLKRRLGLTAREFIDQYTRDCTLDGQGMPGLKLATREGGTACTFLRPEGCSMYGDRPSACRYYALGAMAMRRKDAPTDESSYFLVKEEHCLGHYEDKEQTVREYLQEQGLDEYEAVNREWQRIILKKRSAGPAIGRPNPRSFELFFLASYDIEGFRRFICSPQFEELFDLDAGTRQLLIGDDLELLRFALRFLRQALFGETFLAVRPDAAARRLARVRERAEALEQEAAQRRAAQQDDIYDSLGEEDD